MKKQLFSMAAVLLLGAAVTSCEKEDNDAQNSVFRATIENTGKQYVDGVRLEWNYHTDEGGDWISIVDPISCAWAYATALPPAGCTESHGPIAIFDLLDENSYVFEGFNMNLSHSSYIALCGLRFENMEDNGDVLTKLESYTGATATGIPTPMACCTSPGNPTDLHFKNLFGVLKVHITTSRTSDLTNITVQSDEHNLSGYFFISFDADNNPSILSTGRGYDPSEGGLYPDRLYYYIEDQCDGKDYYIPIAPGTYNDLSVSFSFFPESPIVKNLHGTLTVEANKMYTYNVVL